MKLFRNQIASIPLISVYHNSNFSPNDIESVLKPLFGSYYGTRQLRKLIAGADHTWCVYDRRVNQYVACALVESRSVDNTLYITLFGVAKSSQGQGIGKLLLNQIINWGRKQKYFAITLHTQVDNEKAIGLYEKVGFRKLYYLKDFFLRYGFLSFFQIYQRDAYEMILYL